MPDYLGDTIQLIAVVSGTGLDVSLKTGSNACSISLKAEQTCIADMSAGVRPSQSRPDGDRNSPDSFGLISQFSCCRLRRSIITSLVFALSWALGHRPGTVAARISIARGYGVLTSLLELTLAKHHDAAAYATVYQQRRRIHIPDLLEPDQAGSLHDILMESSWNRVINSGRKVFDITPEQQASLSEEQSEGLRSRVLAAAREHYQFSYENHRLSERGEAYHDPTHPLSSVVTFLNSALLLRFVRRMTGVHDISYADAQATRFGPGDFLHIHDDVDVIKKRRLAYVLNLTRRWSPEWGGILNFVDDDGHVSEGYTPCFNALNVFDVGVKHFVSIVAPFAGEPRISVTGWFRAR